MGLMKSHEVPYGIEVFVIVPDVYEPAVKAGISRLRDSLSREFPSFSFSLGHAVDDDIDDFVVVPVKGAVGDGARSAVTLETISSEQCEDIARHLRGFVEGQVSKPN